MRSSLEELIFVVGKLLKKYIFLFQCALLVYDLGILGDDKDLANAVWRRFFLASEPDFQKIELLVRYIRRNMALLETISIENLILKNEVQWLKLK